MSKEIPNSQELTSRESLYQPLKLPEYKKDFGHIAEDIIMEALEKSAGLIIEKVEKATEREDKEERVDFWIKFRGVEEPIGIQYSITANEDKLQEKEDISRYKDYKATKDNRGDALINWKGKLDKVVIQGNKEKFIRYWNEAQEKKANPADLVGEEVIRDFFSQLILKLDSVNPYRNDIIIQALKRIAIEKNLREKKGAKN